MRNHGIWPLATAMLAVGGCHNTDTSFEPVALAVPQAGLATGPRLSGSGDRLYLSWMERGDDGAALLYSKLEDGGWTPANTLVSGIDMFVNWADMPSVQPLGDHRLSAHWLQMSADTTYAYDVVFVQSGDDGGTWSEPMRPHTDGTPTEHGFVSMYADGPNTGLIWLDGRKMVNETTDDPVASGMTLRAASIDPTSGFASEQQVDELVCDCCQTDIAIAASGPVAAYRNRSTAEIRDIYVTRLIDGVWQPGKAVDDDGWEIPGCPVNGPAVVADRDFVAVAWFTGAGGQPTVKLAISRDSGASFSAAEVVESGEVLGRVGLAYLGAGNVAVSWVHSAGNAANELVVRRYDSEGAPGADRIIADNVGSFSVPQVAVAGDQLFAIWTSGTGRDDQMHAASLPISSL